MYNAIAATVQPANIRFELSQPAQDGVRELTDFEMDYVSGAGFGSCLAAAVGTGALFGAVFGNPILGAGLGLARGILFCPTPAH